MRVLHVVTLVSPDGAFGGPVAVASNQCRELRARGHQVLVTAGVRGHTVVPTHLGGTPLRGFAAHQVVPGAGFSGLAAPGMKLWLRRALDGADVVHVHLARDLVTLPAAWMARHAGVPYVLQPHGMVVESANPLAGPLDAALTRRVLSDAAAVLHLTPEERDGLRTVLPDAGHLLPLRNGVPDAAVSPVPEGRPEVLFCARLQERKRPLQFVELAERLLARGVDASFVLVGPDGGEGDAVTARIGAIGDPARVRWEGALDPAQVLDRVARASLVVLPSVDEPYPMSVLEAMSVGRGVVVTTSCGLADAVRAAAAGVVVDETIEGLEAGVIGVLESPGSTAALGARAAEAARTEFGMAPVVDRLEEVYLDAIDATGRRLGSS